MKRTKNKETYVEKSLLRYDGTANKTILHKGSGAESEYAAGWETSANMCRDWYRCMCTDICDPSAQNQSQVAFLTC